MVCETLVPRVEQSLLQNLAGQWAEEELWGHLTIRGDEGSLKGVEQKVHATELVVRSYTSLRITGFFNTSNSVSPNKRGVCIARTHHSGARAKGSSLHMAVPSEMFVVAIKPFPLFWSKYSTLRARPFCVYLRGSRPGRS